MIPCLIFLNWNFLSHWKCSKHKSDQDFVFSWLSVKKKNTNLCKERLQSELLSLQTKFCEKFLCLKVLINYISHQIKKYSFLVFEYESKQQSGHSVYYAKFGQRTWVRKNITLASLAQVALYMCKYFQVISKYDLCGVQIWQMMYTMVQAKTVKYLITKFYPYFIKWFVPI